MTIKRMDHVSVVVEDLPAAIAFFTTLGMAREGEAAIEGDWVDRVNRLESVQVDIVMMRTPDGHGQLELTKFRNPKLVEIEPKIAPPNTLGLRSVMFTVESVDDTVAPCAPRAANSLARWPSTRTSTGSATCEALRASSSRWPRNSSDSFTALGTPVAPRRSFYSIPCLALHPSFSPACAAVLLGELNGNSPAIYG